nr:unnamed protein product [Callosobruchus analis]
MAPKKHACFKNFSGPSTAGTRYYIKGFCHSVKQHALVYKQVIGAGDSSVYAKNSRKSPIQQKRGKDRVRQSHDPLCKQKVTKLSDITSISLPGYQRLKEGIKAITRNIGDPTALRGEVSTIPNHVFGR